MSLLRSALLEAAESQWLAHNLPRMWFSRRAVRRFMPGEELADALNECEQLAANGMGSVITRLGENISTLSEAHAIREHYVAAIAEIARRGTPTHLSIKPTQLGMDISPAETAGHVRALAASSRSIDAPVWIDMESSRYVDATLELFRTTQAENSNVGLCIQAYLRRTPRDLAALLEGTTAVRLVKGAYREPPEVAWTNKREVDEQYLALANEMLQAARTHTVGHAPAFATHDARIISEIGERARRLNVPRENFEFQMLYGIQTQLQKKLAGEGFRLRVLISYGAAWFAWYMRRLAERPANMWFVARSMLQP